MVLGSANIYLFCVWYTAVHTVTVCLCVSYWWIFFFCLPQRHRFGGHWYGSVECYSFRSVTYYSTFCIESFVGDRKNDGIFMSVRVFCICVYLLVSVTVGWRDFLVDGNDAALNENCHHLIHLQSRWSTTERERTREWRRREKN